MFQLRPLDDVPSPSTINSLLSPFYSEDGLAQHEKRPYLTDFYSVMTWLREPTGIAFSVREAIASSTHSGTYSLRYPLGRVFLAPLQGDQRWQRLCDIPYDSQDDPVFRAGWIVGEDCHTAELITKAFRPGWTRYGRLSSPRAWQDC